LAEGGPRCRLRRWLPARDQRTDRRLLGGLLGGDGAEARSGLVSEALLHAHAYLEAGADCVYPIALSASDALRRFTSEVRGPVNVLALPQAPSLDELAAAGVARISWGLLLYRQATARLQEQLASLATEK
jgi:2-methylisocitrate lyase-like PEP mutase family enzyme